MDLIWWVLSIAVWLVLFVAAISVARSKGRSLLLWGIIAFFIPLIALIIVAVLPAKRPEAG